MLLALQLAISMQRLVDDYVAAPILRSAHVGVLITQAKNQRMLAQHNVDDVFTPASNMKLLVGSVARAKLGASFAFHTRVEAQGSTLYLVGGGDAHLTVKDLDAAASAVVNADMMSVDRIVVDATRYSPQRYAPGWSIDDIPYDYAAPVSAMSLEENTLHIHIDPAHRVGKPVHLQSTPQTSVVTIVNDATTGLFGSADTTDIERPWDEPTTIRIVGSYPLAAATPDDFDAAVPDPPSYAGDIFARALARHGVIVRDGYSAGQAPADTRVLWSHDSEPMAGLLAQMWLPSDNLMAELLLRELGVSASGPPGTIASGAKVEREWLRSIGVDPGQVDIADGSGLSIYDRVTPRDLVTVLMADWNAPWRADVISGLPVAGKSGTLREAYIGTPAAGNLIAKTGTLMHVRTISGFIRTRTHGYLIFSLLINDWMNHGPSDVTALRMLDSRFFSSLASS